MDEIKGTEESKKRYFEQLNSKIIAVDYDDTITLSVPYPHLAPLNPEAKKYLDLLHEKGYRLVLWSARVPESYERAYNRCIHEFGLDYLERDSDELIHGATGKLVASFYIDDKSYFGKVDWEAVYNYIIENI